MAQALLRIFVCYRREETRFAARALAQSIDQHLADAELFIDVDRRAIAIGENWRQRIQSVIDASDVVIAIIGDRWADISDTDGTRKIDKLDDPVRLELERALDRNILVVPVRLDEARMPRASDLPDSISELVFMQGAELRHSRWDDDVRELIESLEHVRPELGRRRLAREEPRGEASVRPRVSTDGGRLRAAIGLETKGGVFTPLIPAGTPLPARAAETFTTALDNQPSVELHLLQGASEMAAFNATLATFQLVGIPPAPQGVPEIEVIFEIDEHGVLDVTARDLATGNRQQVSVDVPSAVRDDELDQLIRDGEARADMTRDLRRLADARNEADAFISRVEHALREHRDSLPREVVASIERRVDALRTASVANDPGTIDAATAELAGVSRELAKLVVELGAGEHAGDPAPEER